MNARHVREKGVSPIAQTGCSVRAALWLAVFSAAGVYPSALVAQPNASPVATNLADRWETRSTLPSPRQNHTAVWTGHEVLLWGGGGGGVFFNTGGRYDAGAETWRPINTSNAPPGRWYHGAVWTGTEMLVWGGRAAFFPASANRGDGGRYDPASDSWRPLATAGAPSPRSQFATVWTGSQMLVWGGISEANVALAMGARYDPASDTWTRITTNGAPSARFDLAAVWTGTELIVWGGGTDWTGATQRSLADGARYNPLTDRWSPLSTNGAPPAAAGPSAIWTGNEMIVWGGADYAQMTRSGGLATLASGGRYNPITDSWQPVSQGNAPTSRGQHRAVWTGHELVVWGGVSNTDAASVLLNTGARYDPPSDTWAALTLQDAPAARANPTAIWTGQAMLIFGGWSGSSDLNSHHAWIPGHAQPEFDVSRDFSLASNPNGVWGYGWKASLGGAYTPFLNSHVSAFGNGVPFEVWAHESDLPAVACNTSTNTGINDGGAAVFPPGTVWFVGGWDGWPQNFCVIRFTVPSGQAGTYKLESEVRPQLDGAASQDGDYHVVVNGVEVFGEFLPPNFVSGYTNLLVLAEGETVDFMAGRGPDGRQYGSGLKLQATLSLMSRVMPLAPVIVAQPQSQTVLAGATATFAVEATGTAPLRYQWQFNGEPLAGKTNATLVLSNLQVGQAGNYSVAVANVAGTVTSSNAILIVNLPPAGPSYDLSRDFSLGSNPNGVWSYGWAPALAGPFERIQAARTFYSDNGVPIEIWALATYVPPFVAKVVGPDIAVSDGGNFTAPAGTIYFGPGLDGTSNNFGVIRFTVPAGSGGDYRIETAVQSLFDHARSQDADFHVARNGQELFGDFLPPNSHSGYTNTLRLAAGDTIDFAIGRGADGLTYDTGLKIQATITALSVSTNAPAPVPEGLVGWWPGDGSAADLAAGNGGTLLEGATFAPGLVGQGFRFNGQGSYVRIPHRGDYNFSHELTVEFWYLSQSSPETGYGLVGARGGEDGPVNFGINVIPTGLGLFFNDPTVADGDDADQGGTFEASRTLPIPEPGVFHHLGATYKQVSPDQVELKTFVDGRLVRTKLINASLSRAVSDAPIIIGRSAEYGGEWFEGIIDEVSLYNRALTDAEIASIHAAGSAGKVKPPACVEAPSGLVAWFPMNGDLVEAVSGVTATAVGGPSFMTGEVGQALEFDGADDEVTVQPSTSFDVGAGDGFSIEAWVNPQSVLMQPIVEWSPGPGVTGVHFWLGVYGAGSLFANLIDVEGIHHSWRSDTDIVQANVTQHVAMSYDKPAGLLRFYLNGLKVTEYAIGTFTPQTSYPLLIGWRPQGEHFQGWLDELSIYDRVLSDGEMHAIYAAGAAGKCPPAGPGHCAPAPAGLVAWWPAEGNVADAADGHQGTLLEGTTFVPGKVGQALSFTGGASGVRVPASPDLDVGAGPGLTIEGWIQPRDLSQRSPLVEWNRGGPDLIEWGVHLYILRPDEFYLGAGNLFANLAESGGYPHLLMAPGGTITANTWQHVALTYDRYSGLARLYRNGVIVAEQNLGSIRPETTYDVYLGRRPAGDAVLSYNGLLDEVSIYGRALTVEEIVAIFHAGSAGKCSANPPVTCSPPASGLVGWWPGNGDAADVVGGNTGTLNGVPFGSGQVGQAFQFDAARTGVDVGNPPSLHLQTLTIEAWIRRASTDRVTLDVYENAALFACAWGGYGFAIADDGRLFLSKVGYGGVFSHLAVTDASFHHVAVTKAGSNVVLYLDGMPETVEPYDPGFVFAAPMAIGARGSDFYNTFWGAIDEVSIYNRALSPAEIAAIHAASRAGKCPAGSTGDGISDTWRQQYFGPDYATDPRALATADPDGDGANNYREFLDGTDPLDAHSVLRAPIWVSTFAGSGEEGGADGFRTEATFHTLTGLKRDPTGRLWVTESSFSGWLAPSIGSHRIRIIETNGLVGTFAGSAEPGLVEGPAATARFAGPRDVVFDSHGDAFVVDHANHRVRKITAAGLVSTFVGSTPGFRDAVGTNAQFYMPFGMTIDSHDNLYVADFGNTRIRKVTPEAVVTTVAGSVPGDRDGDVSVATFNGPNDVEIAPDGSLYVSDWVNGRVRKISPDGIVSTFASGLTYNHAVQVDAQGDIYAVCGGCLALIKFKPDGTQVWRYEPTAGFQDGPAETAQFGFLSDGVVLPDGNYLLNDTANHRIRLIEVGVRPLLRIEPPGGLFTDRQPVTLHALAGAGELHYTLDGSEPTAASALYTGPIPLTETATVKAQVFVNGHAVSEIAAAMFTRVDSLPPTILAQPESVTVIAGQPAALAVTATGSPPLRYQWYFQGQPVASASNDTLVVTSALSTDAGPYLVVVSNEGGAVTSRVATVTVLPGRTLALTSPPAQQEGSSIIVPLDLISDGDVAGMSFVLRYNPDYLCNAELVWAPFFDDTFHTVNASTPGEIWAAFALGGDGVPAGTQSVASVSFLLRSVPYDLNTPLTLEVVDVSSPLGDPITVGNLTRHASARVIRRVILGDNNANQRLDVGDGTVILRYLVQLDPVRSWDVAGNDLNQNGNLDTGDAIKVLRAAAGLDPQPGGGTYALAAVPESSTGLPKALSTSAESIILSPETLAGTAGGTVAVQVRLENVRTGVSGAAFTLDYPTNALRLTSLGALRLGPIVAGNPLAVWNIAPQNNLTAQSGHVTLAVSSATPWPASNGALAELTFTVQPGATNRYAWSLALRGGELTPDGFANRFPACGNAVFLGRRPLPGFLVGSVRLPGGVFQFRLNGDAGATYVVEASTNLVTWTVLTNLYNASGVSLFADPESPNFPQRFYRLRIPDP